MASSPSGAAQAYLGSFTPFLGVPGYAQNAKSDVFTNALGSIPLANMQAQLELAKAAIPEAYANDRLEKTLEYNKWAVQEQDKQNRRSALRLAAGGFDGLTSILGGVGLPATQRSDPRDLQLAQMSYDSQMRAYRNANRGGTIGATANAVTQLSGS